MGKQGMQRSAAGRSIGRVRLAHCGFPAANLSSLNGFHRARVRSRPGCARRRLPWPASVPASRPGEGRKSDLIGQTELPHRWNEVVVDIGLARQLRQGIALER